ncbi:MAG: hypothetical protein M5U31_00095 [Acidimicrobiia bacterium]|nr:hypothetical protein [Acidimicrobiia bacterium]
MAVNERTRHDLYVGLEELLGVERTSVLMEHLPPVGWADVATRRDLAALGAELRGEFGLELAKAVRTMVFANLTIAFAAVGLAFGAAQLT